jgi:hypothetical protein
MVAGASDGASFSDIETLSTQSLDFSSPNIFRTLEVDVGEAITARMFRVTFTKVSTAGDLYPVMGINYRLIVT